MTRKSDLARKAHKEMYALGTTPDEVHDTLKRLGIEGYVKKCGLCPIAMYWKSKGYTYVSTLRSYSELTTNEVDRLTINHTQPVVDFIDRFDDEYEPYMDLEMRRAAQARSDAATLR